MIENLVKFKKSISDQQYQNLSEKDINTLYFPSDSRKIYLGSRLMAEANTVTSVAGMTGDVVFPTLSVSYINSNGSHDSGLVFDAESEYHHNIDFGKDFVGERIEEGDGVRITLRKLPSLINSGTDYSDYIVTKQYVDNSVNNLLGSADALVYKGTIDVSDSISIILPGIDPAPVLLAGGVAGGDDEYGEVEQYRLTAFTPAADAGHVYKIVNSRGDIKGYINGIEVEVGDMIICNTDDTPAATLPTYAAIASHWDVIQRNETGSVQGPTSAVSNRVAVFNGTSGKSIKDSGFTIGCSVPALAEFTDTANYTGDENYIIVSGRKGECIDLTDDAKQSIDQAGHDHGKLIDVINCLTWS